MAGEISAVLALEALTAQCDLVRADEDKLIADREVRDRLIRSARAAKIPFTTLMARTGLSRDRLIKITHSGDRTLSPEDD